MSAKKKKILLVEDDDSMRRFIEVVLKREGYEIVTAKDGLEGLQFTVKDSFDAVVADAIMPNISGYDLCRMLRQNEYFEKTPFILLSGMENSENDHLADGYILKSDKLKTELTEMLSAFLN